ncbi:MAG: BamA/TamA family outer membrane protein [Candidatus Binatia bacterium]
MRRIVLGGYWLPAALCCVASLLPLGSQARAESRRAAHPQATRSLIPLPEIIVDPNEGTTVGFLPVVLFTTETNSVRSFLAPDVRYNDITGVFPTFRFYDYPDPKQRYFLIAGKGTSRGEFAQANYAGEDLFNGWLDLRGNAEHEQDPFERFFGFGNDTPESSEANFTSTTETGALFTGLNLPQSFQVSLRTRVRHVRVGRGGVTSLKQVREPSSGFATVRGVGGATIVGERLGLTYDTRDFSAIPTRGVFADGSVEIIDKAIGSSASFIKYGIEGKVFVPLQADKKYIVALHAVLDYLQNGQNAPFYEKNSVGGIGSLRGFGSNRFTDNHRFFLQAELRSNVYARTLFGVLAHLEVAPFLDAGKVFKRSREFPLEGLHVVGGVGFRAVVVPQVVAYVDIGTSGGSPVAFTGIDYPF